jgi:hypothetical protein
MAKVWPGFSEPEVKRAVRPTTWSEGRNLAVVLMPDDRIVWCADPRSAHGWESIGDWAIQRLAHLKGDPLIIDPEWAMDCV